MTDDDNNSEMKTINEDDGDESVSIQLSNFNSMAPKLRKKGSLGALAGQSENNIDRYKRHVLNMASHSELAEIVSNGGMSIPIPVKHRSPGKSEFTKVFVSGSMKHNTASKAPVRAELGANTLPGDVARTEPKSLIEMGRQPERKMFTDMALTSVHDARFDYVPNSNIFKRVSVPNLAQSQGHLSIYETNHHKIDKKAIRKKDRSLVREVLYDHHAIQKKTLARTDLSFPNFSHGKTLSKTRPSMAHLSDYNPQYELNNTSI